MVALLAAFIALAMVAAAPGAAGAESAVERRTAKPARSSPSTASTAARIGATIDQGNLDKAESDLWVLLRAHPNLPEGLNLLGIIRGKQQRFSEAEALFRRATALDKNFRGAYLNLAGTQRAQSKLPDAVGTYETALKSFPRDPQLATELASVYLAQKQYPQSLATLQALPAGSLSASAFPILITDLLQLNQAGRARELVAAAATRFPRNQDLRDELANIFLATGMPDEAAKILQAGAAPNGRGAGSAQSLYMQGKIEMAQGKNSAAAQSLQHALRLNPNSIAVRLSLAELAAQQKQYAQALQLLDAAEKMAPTSPEVLRDQVITSLHAGRNQRAAEAAGKLLQLGGENPENLFFAGVAALQMEKWDLAQRLLDQYLARNPQDARGHLALGIAYLHLQELDKARSEMMRCLELDPRETEAEYQLAMVSRTEGKNAAAITGLERVISVQPGNAHAFSALGTLYLQAGEEAKAKTALERAAGLNPNNPETQYQLSLLYNRLGDPERARQHLAQFQKLKAPMSESAPPPSDGPVGPR